MFESYSRSKNYVEAERFSENLSGDHGEVGWFRGSSVHNLPNAESCSHSFSAETIRENSFGEDSLPVGEALDCLVSIQARLGKDDGEVLGLLKRVLMIQEKEFGSSSEELIVTLPKIVYFLEKLEMKDEKFKFRRRLALLRERYKQSL
ncbi:hypothetical protein Bca52824_004214 [Brassica carinata]|uniref:Uncharacterized protein n=1 Tax=Brassica carinata TaxID=52824 RepID=A0A8X7WNQ5_BRACI|nr:hypothetical protein Bca52824_004214 [Brassica carinata]